MHPAAVAASASARRKRFGARRGVAEACWVQGAARDRGTTPVLGAMPVLTAEQDAVAQAFTDSAMTAIVANDFEALQTAVRTYLMRMHPGADLVTFFDYYTHDDPFINGDTLGEDGDTRFRDLLFAALNPKTTYSAHQIKIAEFLGELVCVTTSHNAFHQNRMQWDIDVLGELMNNPSFGRFDLVAGFYAQKMSDDFFNQILDHSDFNTKRSLYNWLLVIAACWDKGEPARNAYYPTNILAMSDDWFWIANQQDNLLVKEHLSHLHALVPSTLSPTEQADGCTFAGHTASSGSHDQIPTTAVKCKILLMTLADELKLPFTVDEYVRRLRWRAARVNVFAFRFLARTLAVIKPRAQTQLDARYKPNDVQICRD